MWNPFKKKAAAGQQGGVSGKQSVTTKANAQAGQQALPTQNMGMLQRLAMKKLASMSESERQQLMAKFMTPENLEKNKDKIMAQLNQMKKSGMITDTQYEEGKKRLGL